MRFTLEINVIARQNLLNADGVIQQCFTPGRCCMETSVDAYKHWRFDIEGLPANLIRRQHVHLNRSVRKRLIIDQTIIPLATKGENIHNSGGQKRTVMWLIEKPQLRHHNSPPSSNRHLDQPCVVQHIGENEKKCTPKSENRRKLTFDTVNDILLHKPAKSASSGLWTNKRNGKVCNGDTRLEELCLEINNLQNNTRSGIYDEVIDILSDNVNKNSEDWDNNRSEVGEKYRSNEARVVAKYGQRPPRLSDPEKDSNPGSTVKLGMTVNLDDKIYFDSPNQGEILNTIRRDGNNHIFPMAWAVVNVENKENWTWFLELLEEDLGCSRGNMLTLMLSLMEAVTNVMPNTEHRKCARHIYENFRKHYHGLEFRQLFWAASKASYP
ncbi:pentatricopeptide repeat-containing protein [Tanacetum coccineum]|uniref:Pentatricopeptide repeat-containing protein n=1 Tax=Tanacetum coccineum TaxID=301880 RepID=A0ABQ5CFR1_9ASTR